jgi:hypothetical protein
MGSDVEQRLSDLKGLGSADVATGLYARILPGATPKRVGRENDSLTSGG